MAGRCRGTKAGGPGTSPQWLRTMAKAMLRQETS